MRTVADRSFCSTQNLAEGRPDGLVRERFGPVAVHMAFVVETASLNYIIRRWTLLGIPIPLCLGPKTIVRESIDSEGRFRFDIKLWHPAIGTLVHYAGWLCRSG